MGSAGPRRSRWTLQGSTDRALSELADLYEDLLEGLTLARVLADDGESRAAQRLLNVSVARVRRRHRAIAGSLDHALEGRPSSEADLVGGDTDVVSAERGR
jgi:hypothetical protein